MQWGQWLQTAGNAAVLRRPTIFGSKVLGVNALQGVWSPVGEKKGAGRAGSAWMGTPEVYFAKQLDNSRVVRTIDPQRSREIAGFSAAVACLFLIAMFYAFQHFSSIEYGYKVEAQKHLREELIENNRALRLEEAALRDPERIDVLARQMGLEQPQAQQMQHLDADTQSGGAEMARMNDVAIITVQ
jgi:hypothetical protein